MDAPEPKNTEKMSSGSAQMVPWIALAALGALLAFIPALWLFDFTVDDALIPARYATHIARGLGYRWNAAGPVTDGVTPLGFPYLLAPFARGGPLPALAAAKVIGLVAWIAAAALLVVAIGRSSRARSRFLALPLLFVSAPLAVWSVAGLETGLATALSAAAVSSISLGAPMRGAIAIGLAAAIRPELLPFALALALTPAPGQAARLSGSNLARAVIAAAPFLVVVSIRLAVFGRFAPLSVYAKPADAWLGTKYAVACFLLTGPLAIVAPLALRRAGAFERGLVFAVVVHFVAVALAGGDWMPLSRLVVPALPAVILAVARLAPFADPRATAARVALALAGELFVSIKIGPTAARVGQDRQRLVEELRPALQDARVIAALDVGWVGAATEATIVDLAGLTDPAIASLPGGHTSKEIPRGWLDARGVDTLVFLLAKDRPAESQWTSSPFARTVELWIAATVPGIEEAFAPVAESRVPGLRYVVLRRKAQSAPDRSPEGP